MITNAKLKWTETPFAGELESHCAAFLALSKDDILEKDSDSDM